MRRLLLFASTLSILLLSGAQSAQATSESRSFRWELGTGAVCAIGPGACPVSAMASNGDTVAIKAQGNLDANAREASGGGTFEHRTSSGALLASGTLKAKRLLDFSFYGCDTSGFFPSDYCGGRAVLLVQLVGHPASNPSAKIKATGILVVTCLFGSPPANANEGFTLDVKHLINFNIDTPFMGDTLFIQTSDD